MNHDERYNAAMRRLQAAGFLQVSAQSLADVCRQHCRLLVLLQADAVKHPEVADSWVIVPELVKQADAGANTLVAAFASYEESAKLARQYRIVKFPALLFFQQQRYIGCVGSLLPWQEYLAAVNSYINQPLHDDIPVMMTP